MKVEPDEFMKAHHLHVQKTIVTEETKQILGGGFKYFLFSPLFGEDSHFD